MDPGMLPSLRHRIHYHNSSLRLELFRKRFELAGLRSGRYPPPSYVLWDCTRRCNLSCLHCGAAKEHYDNELTTAQMKTLIEELAHLRVHTFAVTGGEPLLRRDLIELLTHASRLGMKTGVATNGFVLDLNKARELKDAGVSSIQISLDGDKNTHNHIRQNPLAYERALQALRNCRAAGIRMITVSSVISSLNLDKLDQLKQILVQEGIDLWKIIPLMPIGRAEKTDLQIESEALEHLLAFIERSRSDIPILIGENLTYLGKDEVRYRNKVTYCPVGLSACCIGVDGKIRGCPEMPDDPQFLEGNILQQSFDDIWQNGFTAYRNQTLLEHDPLCNICSLWKKCRGGCWVMRLGEVHCIKRWRTG